MGAACLIAAAWQLGAYSAAWAQQYRWVDEKGRVHYTDTPPPPSAKSTQKKNLKGNAVGQQPNYALLDSSRLIVVSICIETEHLMRPNALS